MTVAVVLLPGMDGTGDLFAPLVEQLKGAATTVVVQYPTAEALGYGELTTLARAALPRDRPYILLGESFSGPIAIRLAAEKPKGLIGLVLCVSFASSPMSWLRPLKPLIPVAPIGVLARVLGPRKLMGRFRTAAATRLFHQALARVSTRVLRSRILAAVEVDVSTQLAQVDVPTVYLRATEDALLSDSAADEFRRGAAAGKVVSIVGPHSLALCVPDAVCEAIMELTRQCGASSD
jgi:pimeloyl-ACP methyl ester carboxylesterase